MSDRQRNRLGGRAWHWQWSPASMVFCFGGHCQAGALKNTPSACLPISLSGWLPAHAHSCYPAAIYTYTPHTRTTRDLHIFPPRPCIEGAQPHAGATWYGVAAIRHRPSADLVLGRGRRSGTCVLVLGCLCGYRRLSPRRATAATANTHTHTRQQ